MAQTIKIKRSATSGNKLTGSNSIAGEIGMNTADKSLYIQTGSTDASVVTVYDDSILHLDDTNNRVGIGTTSPSYTFDVHVAGGNTVNFRSTDNRMQIRLVDNDTTGYLGVENSTAYLGLTAGISEDNLSVKSDGSVGIGITDPKKDLHVLGSTGNAGSTTVRIGGDAGGSGNHTSRLELAESANATGMQYGFSFTTDGNSTNNLLIKSHENNTTGTNAISVKRGNGFVGIGHAAPLYQLDVEGTGRFTGAVTLDSTLSFSDTTAANVLDLNNNNIIDVNRISFADAGPNEGLEWSGGNTKIFESPDDLTTNTAGNLQFLYNGTRRLSVNNTGIDINGTITGATNISKQVARTATGGTGTEDGPNTWAKLATYSVTNNYNDGTFIYGVVTEEQSVPTAGTIIVRVRWGDLAGSINPTVKAEWTSKNSGNTLGTDAFKLIGDGVSDDIELWVQKDVNYGCIELWELAYRKEDSNYVSVSYETNSAWQSSTPTGTAVNETSGTLTFDGKEVLLGDEFNNTTDFKLSGKLNVLASVDTNDAAYIRNSGTGAAFAVNQQGTGDILRVDDNSVTKLIVKDGGNVGIGTTAPEGLMHFSSSSDYDIVFDNTSEEKFRLRHGSSGLYLTGPDTNTLAFGVDQNHDVKMFNTSGSAYATFDGSTSRVGIGTTSPGTKLQISDSATPVLRIEHTGGTARYVDIYNSSGTMYLRARNDTANGPIIFQGGGGGTNTEYARFQSTGKMGIGTTSPSYHLHVDAGNNNTTALFESDGIANVVVSGGTNRGSFVVQHSGTTTGAVIAKDGGGLEFGVGANYATNVRMVLDSNGAVTFNDAFTFPTAIGSAGQVLKVPTSGTTLYWANEAAASVGTSLSDADGDTKIQVEETTDEDRIRFDTAGTQRMVLNELGRLGINTGTPNYLLDIESTSSALLRIYNTGSNVLTSLIAQNDLGTAKFSTQSGYSRIHSGSTLTYAANGTNSIFYSSGTEKMRLTGTGLTIGTATDTTTLEFPDKTGIPDSPTETNDKVQLIKMGQGGNGGMWQTTGRGGMLISSADDSLVLANGDVGRLYDPDAGGHHPGVANETLALLSDFDIRFTTGLQDGWSGGSTYSPKTSIITAEGSFGIGTTSPDSFHANASNLVVGSGSGTEGITINSGTANYGVIYFADGTSGSAAYAGNINYNHSDNSMRFGTAGSTTSVVIDSSGDVGIGTTSPEAKLHTVGHSRLDGAMLQKSNLSIGSGNISTGNEYISHNGPILTNGSTGNINQYGYFRGYQAVYGTDGTNGYNPYAQGSYSNPVFEFVSNNRGSISLPTDSAIRGGYLYQFVLGNSGSGGTNSGVELTNSNTTLLWGITSSNHAYFANRVGIGASSPATSLEIAEANPVIRLRDTNTQAYADISADSGVGGLIINADVGNNAANSYMSLRVDNTTRMYINASGNVGIGTDTPAKRLHVSTNNVGIATTYGISIVEATDSQVDLISSSSGTWGSGINLVEGAGTSNTDIWSIVRQTTGGTGDSSLQFNFGTSNNHQNTNKVTFDSNGSITSSGLFTSSQNQQGFRHIAPDVMSGHTSRNEMTFSWTADETRWYMFPTVDGSGNFGRELSFDYSSEEWSIEGPVTLSSLSTGNITTTGYLRGPSTFTIDPSAHGDNTGTVVIAGNLQVDGTTTTINSTTLTVDDLNITLASGAVNAAAANGAGITVDTAGAQLTYDATQDRWNMNKGLELLGTPLVVGTGTTDVGRVENSSGVFSLTAYTTREIAFGNDTNGEHVRIDNNGNVGIGTNSPEKLLHVTGQGKFEGRVTIEDNAVPLMFNQADQSNGTVGKWWRMPVDGTSLRFDVSLTNDDLFSTYRDVLSLNTSGEVQVHGKLAVNNRSATAYVDSVVPDGSALSLRLGRADESSYWDFNHAGNDLRIYNNDGTGSNVLIGLNAGGGILDNKVGIGTATPTQKLDVAGIIKTGGIAHPEIELVPSGSVGNADIRFDGTSFDIRSNSSSAYLTLQTSTTERLKITSTGNFEFNNGNFTEVGTVSSGAITSSGDLLISKTDPTITLFDNSGANTNPNGTIIFSEVSGTNNFKINYNGANDRLEFRGLIGATDTEIVRINRGTDPALHIFGREHLEYSVQATANKAYGLVVRGNDSGSTGEAASIFLGGIHNTVRGAYLAAEIQSASNDHDLIIATSGPSAQPSERMRITGDGKVGIGQSLPSAKLHVKDASFPQLKLEDADDTMELGYAGTNFYFKRNDNDGSITFRRADNSDVMSVAMSTKRVGIGTASPTYGLQVMNNQTSQSATGTMYVQASLNGSGKGLVIDSNTRTTSDNSVAALETITRANTTGLKVQVDGNVGIGTSDPLAKLQVEALGIDTTITTTSATTEATIDSFAAATFRSARYTIQVTNTTDSTYHMTEILLIHNGTTPNITEYGTVFTGTAAEATFDADISSGSVRLRATPASADSMTFKVVRHCITV